MKERIAIVGAGLVGCMLGCLLARRGHQVTIFEKRDYLKTTKSVARRSTHLVISNRGWKALDAIESTGEVKRASLPLQGRCVHLEDGSEVFMPYGSAGQSIYAIHRHTLNEILQRRCDETKGLEMRFGMRCVGVDMDRGALTVEPTDSSGCYVFSFDRIFGADGAFSDVKNILSKIVGFECEGRYESYGYKEISIPHGSDVRLNTDVMHAWPRGEVSIFAFPNQDASFTSTLIAPLNTDNTFRNITNVQEFESVIRRLFADLDPDPLKIDFLENPVSKLFSSSSPHWTFGGKVALIGDAAHAMVPFLGQGMNAGFEDCMTVVNLLDKNDEDFTAVLSKYEDLRKANCDAVMKMSSENFIELTKYVSDKAFIQRKLIERRIQILFPDKYVPLYEMIAFTDIPYGEVLHRSIELNSLTDTLMRNLKKGYVETDEQLNDLIYSTVLDDVDRGVYEAKNN